MHNLLTKDLIRYRRQGGEKAKASLPDVYQALLQPRGQADPVLSFDALRPHHRHAWHSFLVQLAFIAITNAKTSTVPTHQQDWETLIRDLTPEYPKDEPWHLVVTDWTKPAFMQPPVTDEELAQKYKLEATAPDLIDMLVTSKNHEVKRGTASDHQLDDWLMALLTTQTMDGTPGRYNYGISRMNKGFSSRPVFSITPNSLLPGDHLRRDLEALLDGYQAPDWQKGHVTLVWTEPWDGLPDEFIPKDALAPLYIEICRRFRLRSKPGDHNHLLCFKAGSEKPRIDNTELKGRTGDPWVPTNASKENIPLTFHKEHANYTWLTAFLTDYEVWDKPYLMLPTEEESHNQEPLTLHFKALAREQGGTEGYHQLQLTIGPNTKRALTDPDEREILKTITRGRVDHLSKIKWAMKTAIHANTLCTSEGITSKRDGDRAQALLAPSAQELDHRITMRFLDDLEKEISAHPDDRDLVRSHWLTDPETGILPLARDILAQALDSLPPMAVHHFRARALAEHAFRGATTNAKDIGPYIGMQDPPQELPHAGRTTDISITPTPTAPPPGTEPIRPISTKMARDHYTLRELHLLSIMDPERNWPDLFHAILEQHEIEPSDKLIPAWASIIQGMAAVSKDLPRQTNSAHSNRTSVGQALNAGNMPFAERPLYNPNHLDLLLSLTGAPLRSKLSSLYRFLAHHHITLDWEELAHFVLNDAHSTQAANPNRLNIARAYTAA